jgi:trehalose synthase
MYGTLALSHRALDELADVAGERTIEELRALARPLEGLRVLNLSVTGFGTGTAELLNSAVPLLTDLGLDAGWEVVRASEEAAAVTRAMYHALSGVPVAWTRDMTDTWISYAQMNAELLTDEFDVIVVHDPQPLAMRSYVTTNTDAKWVMDSHLDLSSAQPDVWMLLRAHVDKFDLAVFPAESYVPPDLPIPVRVVTPAIDPKNARNMPLPDNLVRTVLGQSGIDPDRPVLCQMAPCEPASDLGGVVDVWQEVRRRRPGVQLALVLTTEPRDPASRACFEEVAARCHDEADAFMVPIGRPLGDVEINAFQRATSVMIQKGLRKGFGLWISDALWKGRPCVVAPVCSLPEQVLDGETGLLASTTEDFVEAVDRLLGDPALAQKLGENGHRHVAARFLITRYLRDYLNILNALHRTA